MTKDPSASAILFLRWNSSTQYHRSTDTDEDARLEAEGSSLRFLFQLLSVFLSLFLVVVSPANEADNKSRLAFLAERCERFRSNPILRESSSKSEGFFLRVSQ